MSWYQINIDDNALTEQINSILDTILNRELNSKFSGTGDIIACAVKDLIYSQLLERGIDNDT